MRQCEDVFQVLRKNAGCIPLSSWGFEKIGYKSKHEHFWKPKISPHAVLDMSVLHTVLPSMPFLDSFLLGTEKIEFKKHVDIAWKFFFD